jgi:hypothetical protein
MSPYPLDLQKPRANLRFCGWEGDRCDNLIGGKGILLHAHEKILYLKGTGTTWT